MKSAKVFLQIVALFVYALITIATGSAVWNSHPSGTIAVFACLLMLANGYVIYRKAMAMSKSIKENGGNQL